MCQIDNGKPFDFGKTAQNYAQYRDIYPEAFYEAVIKQRFCITGQRVLDIGTGTGVLPRNLYPFGAEFVGVDISAEQIEQAKRLSAAQNMNIEYYCMPAEQLSFPDNSFDVVTALQCFMYFDHNILAPKIAKLLKPNGVFIILYMAWLPEEDEIAKASEALILQYNPNWTGGGETRKPIAIPQIYNDYFSVGDTAHPRYASVFDLEVPFTRESWNGRMKTCRGIGASLSSAEVDAFSAEHMALLERLAPARFTIKHYAAITTLRV